MFTEEILSYIFPKTSMDKISNYVIPLNETTEMYQINTPLRAAAFIAQVGHESGGLNRIIENLNYSVEGLLRTFPKYFTLDLARQYARKPEKIANRVYANRMGNGYEQSGDGWKFRGRGLIQITGKNNYSSFAKEFVMSIDDVILFLETPEGACKSSGFFWNMMKLNELADNGKFITITKKINGGLTGINERSKLYEKAKLTLI